MVAIRKREMNHLCKFDGRFGVTSDFPFIKRSLDAKFRDSGYAVEAQFSLGEASINTLDGLYTDRTTSFPIVTFSPRYYETEFYPGSGNVSGDRIPDHCVIPLGTSGDDIYIHDPLVGLHRPRDVADRMAVVKIPRIQFLSLWSEANRSYELFWLNRTAAMIEEFGE
jgi:hypothetical protein